MFSGFAVKKTPPTNKEQASSISRPSMDHLCFKNRSRDLWEEIDMIDSKASRIDYAQEPGKGKHKARTLESKAGWNPVEAEGSWVKWKGAEQWKVLKWVAPEDGSGKSWRELGKKQTNQLDQRRKYWVKRSRKFSKCWQWWDPASELFRPKQIEKEVYKIKRVMDFCEITESGGAIDQVLKGPEKTDEGQRAEENQQDPKIIG